MSDLDHEKPLLPSLLDRLIDLEPGDSSEPLWRGSYKLDELREHVRRDLEFLLNTRHGRYDLLRQTGELSVSCLSYGVPDATGVVGGGKDFQEHMRASVERAIRDFETRLINVRVELQESDSQFDRNLRLMIHATLCVDPIVDLVTFDTTIESTTGIYEVHSS